MAALALEEAAQVAALAREEGSLAAPVAALAREGMAEVEVKGVATRADRAHYPRERRFHKVVCEAHFAENSSLPSYLGSEQVVFPS